MTSAGNYGALSTERGTVDIVWTLVGDRFRMRWTEKPGSPVAPPTHQDFGCTVVPTLTKVSTNGCADIIFDPAGVEWRLDCWTAEALVTERHEKPFGATIATISGRSMMRVLIVEDDPFIAMDLVEQLKEASYETVGPASTVADALKLVASEVVEGAVLDVNLGRETSEPIAIELNLQDVPFVCVSGYDTDQLPEAFRGAPCLVKPFQIDRLLELLKTLDNRQRGAEKPPGAPPCGSV